MMTRPDVDKLTCNAHIATVTGTLTATGAWQPLSLTYTARYATAAQRLALQARDGDTCIHPGCTVPVNRCIGHHIIHWADGGPSDLWNYAFTCGHHHDDVHHGNLIIIKPDGSYTTTRPQRQ